MFLETGDAATSQGWTAFVLDTNGNGRRDQYVEPGQPIDPTKDTPITAGYDGIGVSPVDGSIWGSVMGFPGAETGAAPVSALPGRALGREQLQYIPKREAQVPTKPRYTLVSKHPRRPGWPIGLEDRLRGRCQMRNYLGGSPIAALAMGAVWSLASIAAAGQAPTAAPTSFGGCPAEALAFHTCALEKAKTFNPPRTPDGTPDLQGYWRGRITMDRSVEGVDESEPMTRSPLSTWPVAPSLIVDPPDRKIPYQPWAAEVGRKGQNFQKYIDPRTVCWGGTLSRSFSDLVQILQPSGEPYVLLLFEDLRVQRIIATDGRPHIGDNIKLLTGDSVGRWEGNTFVVDVTNLSGYTWFDDAGNFHTNAAHLVERLTMIDPDTIHYEVTVSDPKAYTRLWKMAWALVRDTQPGFELLEEACWEGERAAPRFREQGYRYYFGDTWPSR